MASTCKACGVEIQASTAEATGGLCAPCGKAESPDSDPIASIRKKSYGVWVPYKPNPTTFIIAMFHPGFCADLTHWQIHLAIDGELKQQIQWNNFNRPDQKKRIEVRSKTVPSEILDTIRQTIGLIDLKSVALLHELRLWTMQPWCHWKFQRVRYRRASRCSRSDTMQRGGSFQRMRCSAIT